VQRIQDLRKRGEGNKILANRKKATELLGCMPIHLLRLGMCAPNFFSSKPRPRGGQWATEGESTNRHRSWWEPWLGYPAVKSVRKKDEEPETKNQSKGKPLTNDQKV